MLVQRYMVLLARMVAGLLLSNGHIDGEAFYRPLMLWNCCCVAVISVDSPVSSCSAGSRAGPVGAT